MNLRALARSPLFWILVAAAGLRLAGLFWGLPASDGWDDDGFAPRNFLTALALTWKPGSFFTYPPLHALLLAIPSLPVAGWALAHAPSLSQHDVIAAITQPAYATYFAVVARVISLCMSLGIIWSVGEMARLLADGALGDSRAAPIKGSRAGLFAAAAAALNMALTYYGQVSNLDVPYLFWAMLSLLAVMRAIAWQEPRRFWHAALLAGAAVATKDQAYALFLLSLPLGLVLWFAADAWPRRHARLVLMTLVYAALAALALLLLVDGALTNPSGFLRRIAFLAGPASGDYAQYAQGSKGLLALLADMGAYYARGYGLVALAVAGLGLIGQLSRYRGEKSVWVAGLLPLLAMLSFTLCFNVIALRSDDRFLLPQGILACVYIGIAVEMIGHVRLWLRLGAQAVVAMTALLAVHQCIAVDAAMLLDPRYDAGNWLAAAARPGDTIEVYDRNWLLPRFPPAARIVRVGQGDLKRRNPLPDVTELQQDYSAPRTPRFILVSGVWARRFMRHEIPPAPGRVLPPVQQEDLRNADARQYFQALNFGRLPYRLAHVARYQGRFWPLVHIHDSLDEPIGIFERLP